MIDGAILSIIRRWNLRDQIPLREIARRLGISRNTVRRYLRTDVTAPTYPARQSPSKLNGHHRPVTDSSVPGCAPSRHARAFLTDHRDGNFGVARDEGEQQFRNAIALSYLSP